MIESVSGHVLFAEHEGVFVFHYVGRIGYPMGPSLRLFLETVIDEKNPKGLVFDLSRTLSIDSTNLGILARAADKMRRRLGHPPIIVAIQDDLRDFLRSMSFHEIFHIVDQRWNAQTGTQVPIEPTSEGALLHTMLEAHQTLLRMSEENKARFSDVVMWLEAEQERRPRS